MEHFTTEMKNRTRAERGNYVVVCRACQREVRMSEMVLSGTKNSCPYCGCFVFGPVNSGNVITK